jgi:hypothetical protein
MSYVGDRPGKAQRRRGGQLDCPGASAACCNSLLIQWHRHPFSCVQPCIQLLEILLGPETGPLQGVLCTLFWSLCTTHTHGGTYMHIHISVGPCGAYTSGCESGSLAAAGLVDSTVWLTVDGICRTFLTNLGFDQGFIGQDLGSCQTCMHVKAITFITCTLTHGPQPTERPRWWWWWWWGGLSLGRGTCVSLRPPPPHQTSKGR